MSFSIFKKRTENTFIWKSLCETVNAILFLTFWCWYFFCGNCNFFLFFFSLSLYVFYIIIIILYCLFVVSLMVVFIYFSVLVKASPFSACHTAFRQLLWMIFQKQIITFFNDYVYKNGNTVNSRSNSRYSPTIDMQIHPFQGKYNTIWRNTKC